MYDRGNIDERLIHIAPLLFLNLTYYEVERMPQCSLWPGFCLAREIKLCKQSFWTLKYQAQAALLILISRDRRERGREREGGAERFTEIERKRH